MERPRPLAAIHDHRGSRTLEGCITNPKSVPRGPATAVCWPSNGRPGCDTGRWAPQPDGELRGVRLGRSAVWRLLLSAAVRFGRGGFGQVHRAAAVEAGA